MKATLARRLALLALLAAACAPRTLPGTDIRDDRDTRAIFEVLQQYRDALQKRDAPAILALVGPDYFDAGGTPEPEDDADRALLAQRLPEDLAKVDAVKLDLTYRKIQVQGERAVAEVFYDGWYRVRTAGGVVPRRDSDIHQIRFHKVEGKWLISGGL